MSHGKYPVVSAGGGDDLGGGRGWYTQDQLSPSSPATRTTMWPHSHTQTGSSPGS